MELKKIKDLMTLMTKQQFQKLVISEGDSHIELERACSCEKTHTPVFVHQGDASRQPTGRGDIPAAHTSPLPPKEEIPGKYVTSPMVGTFYATPGPAEPPFVQPGDHVKAGDVVCIIEAMKVMNEVKAGVAGKVEELLVENGHPVEFGSKLFRIT